MKKKLKSKKKVDETPQEKNPIKTETAFQGQQAKFNIFYIVPFRETDHIQLCLFTEVILTTA